ncbi:MAG: CDP-glycerol glycerophosphotransferase family protein [Clostridium sp.]|nr:CDP-glycerol glycerophosphotransferase family protein [Clostridium sp.]
MRKLKFQIKQQLKMFSQHVLFPLVYNLNRFKPVHKNKIVLADAHHESCPPHMKQVRDALLHLCFDVQECFFDLGKISAFAGMKKMLGFMRLYAVSGCVIICNNFLPVAACKKRKETKVIQLWHGCGAFKKFGYDAFDDIPKGYRGNVYKNYDLVTVSGKYCVPFFQSAMRLGKGIVKPLGCCITDRLFDKEYLSLCREKFKRTHPDAEGKRVVLWAPTFRENAGTATVVGGEYIDRLAKLYQNELYVIKALHPMSEGGTREAGRMPYDQEEGGTREASTELLVCADVLITDYSSIFFEYLLLDRPIVFFAPDYEAYERDRGFYLDFDSLPGHIVKNDNIDEAVRILYNVICGDEKEKDATNEDKMHALRQKFKERYMSACDGHVTERIVKEISR